MEPDLVRPKHVDMLEECLHDAVLGHRFGVSKQPLNVREVRRDVLRCDGRWLDRSSLCFLAIEPLHGCLPSVDIAIGLKPPQGLVTLTTYAGKGQQVRLPVTAVGIPVR